LLLNWEGMGIAILPEKIDSENLRLFLIEQTTRYDASEVNWHLRSLLNWHRYQNIIDEILKWSPGGLILDVGCGFGEISELLRIKGLSVVGLDYGGSRHESKVWKHLRSPFLLGDGCTLPFPSGIFNTVVCCGVLEHVYNEQKFLLECKRVLNKRGLFLCYYLPNETGCESFFAKIGVPTMHKFYTQRKIIELFNKCGYDIIHTSREHVIPELRISNSQKVYNKLRSVITTLDDNLNQSAFNVFGDNWRVYARSK
jgi:ubiquinone/menaquinone biosynthesis C-methylase UbiE